MEGNRMVKIVVGAKEFSLNKMQFDLLASSLEASMGMEVQVPPELEEDGGGGIGEAE
ncbi:MAG: hypothetical protein V1820_02365 [archaeon]